MKKKLSIFFLLFGCFITLFAQETVADSIVQKKAKEPNQGFRFTGYIQAQYQYGQRDVGKLHVGGINRHIGEKAISRFGIRRGRVKLSYDKSIFFGVFQLDVTERGVAVKDVYIAVRDPWTKTNSLHLGVMNRPFGYEIAYSSSLRETPERSLIYKMLFPGERDMGAMLTLNPPHSLNFLKLQAGVFSGNAVNLDIDNYVDFIGRLSVEKTIGENLELGGGFSFYRGRTTNFSSVDYPTVDSTAIASNIQYKMSDAGFVADTLVGVTDSYMKREYFGFDLQFSIKSVIGKSVLRGEYLWGMQPGTRLSSQSPDYKDVAAATLATSEGLYLRNFRGWYLYVIQHIAKLPLGVVFRYDYYDPNVDISNDEIGVEGSHTSFADAAMHSHGFGAFWDIYACFRVMAYMDVQKNEKTPNELHYAVDRKDNIFTLRLQYKF